MKTYTEILNKPFKEITSKDAAAVVRVRHDELREQMNELHRKIAMTRGTSWGDEATLTHVLNQLEEINEHWHV